MVTLIVALVLFTFASLNVATWYGLRALHPRRRWIIAVIVVVCNLFWIAIPFIRGGGRTTTVMRFARSILGPPWFTWLMFILIYATFLLLLALVWFVVGRRRRFGQFGHRPSTVFLSTLGIVFIAGHIQAIVPLRVEHVPIRLAALPPSLQGMRIAQISDLHVGMFSRPARLRRIAEEINRARPDVLLISGDMIDDDPYYVPKLLRGLDHVDATIPIIAVLGNHEMYGDPPGVIRAFQRQRPQLLINRGIELKRNDGSVWIAGVGDSAAQQATPELRPDLPRALEGRPKNAFPIVLSHQPGIFQQARKMGLPLTICGHTHGGQFGIRPLRWTLAGVFLPYHIGLYEQNGSQLYVNTGTGHWVVPFRLGLSPEITVIELRGEKP